jgi:signal transduction histidine kinase
LFLEIFLGIFIYLYLYNTLLDNLDLSLKTQAKAIQRIVTKKHLDIEHFVPDSVYSDPEDLVWDFIYNEVAFNLRNTYIQIYLKNKTIFKSDNLNNDSLYFPQRRDSISLFSFRDTSLSPKPIRAVQVNSGYYSIVVAFPLQHIAQTLNSLTNSFIILAPIFFFISLIGGTIISVKALSRIDAIIRRTEEISALNLDEITGGEKYSDEYGRLVQKMNEMINRIKISIDYMNQFSISAAHELKTPLTILRGETEIALKSPKTPEEYVEVLKSNYEETIRLTKIIDNLFFISKIDHSMIEIQKESVDVDPFLKLIADNLKILGVEKNIQLIVDSKTNSKIEIDKELMTQAFSNLIDNAIKYGENNNVVTLKAEIVNHSNIRFSVINKGEGIPKESIPKIFDRFYRVESSRNRNTGGVGLGLSVVKAIINWHNSEIFVNSIPNDITDFYFDLPKS